MSNSLKSNLWKFYTITALGIRFITPIRIIYLISFGLSFSQIGMMELAAALVIVILEIPTGIFADIVGRKASRLIAYALSILAFSFLSFGSTPTIFIIGWALSGAADAFESGAQDALIFDTLKGLDLEKEYVKMKSHFLLINTVATIIGSIAGAWLYTLDHRLPWYLVTGTIVMSALIFTTVIEPTNLNRHKKIKTQIEEYKQSFKHALSHVTVKRLIILGLILALPMFVFTTLLNQPYLLSRGFSVQSLGFVFAFISGISGLIASFSHLLEQKLKKCYSFLLILVSFTFLLIGMGVLHNAASLILLLVIGFYVIDNYKNIILDNYLNQAIESESRATVLSVQSFVNNIFVSLLFVFIGYMVDIFSIDVVLISMGIVVGLACIPFVGLSWRKERS